MLVDRKPFIYVGARFTSVLLPIQTSQSCFNRDTLAEIAQTRLQIASLEQNNQRLHDAVSGLKEQLVTMEKATHAQWMAMEQLLLCILREPGDGERQTDSVVGETGSQPNARQSRTTRVE
ncbi:MAG: hypothetical protein WKF37_19925 [Bryobacteraceae bacterium]